MVFKIVTRFNCRELNIVHIVSLHRGAYPICLYNRLPTTLRADRGNFLTMGEKMPKELYFRQGDVLFKLIFW